MQTIKTYLKVGAFYIACEADFATSIEAPTVRDRFLLSGTILHRVHRKSVAARLTVV
jgi:hypothetical protein